MSRGLRPTEEEYQALRSRGKAQPATPVAQEVALSQNAHCFVFSYPPSVNHLYFSVVRQSRTKRGKTVIRQVLTEIGREFKRVTALAAREQGARVLKGEICVVFRLYRPRKAGDLENRQKACMDALKGVMWIDDAQIVEIHAYRFDDKINPRVELEISERG